MLKIEVLVKRPPRPRNLQSALSTYVQNFIYFSEKFSKLLKNKLFRSIQLCHVIILYLKIVIRFLDSSLKKYPVDTNTFNIFEIK